MRVTPSRPMEVNREVRAHVRAAGKVLEWDRQIVH